MDFRLVLLVLLALALTSGYGTATAAAAPSGTIGNVQVTAPPVGGGMPGVTADATVTYDCPFEICGRWNAWVTVAPASAACSPYDDRASGGVLGESSPGTRSFSVSWSPRSSTWLPGQQKTCLYVHSSLDGIFDNNILLAEAVFDMPAPRSPSPPPQSIVVPAPRDYDCADFRYREDARPYALSGDPYRLDADHDGIACEELPSRRTPVTAPVTTQPALFLSRDEAAHQARRALSQRYGRKWTRGRGRAVTCPVRTGDTTVGCRASWRYGRVRYRAAVVIQEWRDFYRTTARITGRRRA